ncbi:MAG TPA: type II toxin-antitoxin system RelE/ParE family toxin [Candidatus Kapabacteria bacterium]|nr:type II toxin-antitoxin system RelE/ParE family toxin [Candidatus Kapabacteria bacterium]
MNKIIFDYDFAEYNGKTVMYDFLNELDEFDRAKIIANMDKLVELLSINPYPNQKLSSHIEDGIFELRVKLKNRISRSFFFFAIGKMIIFTNGFIKKTIKTPRNEIDKAKRIRDYWRNKNE